MWGLDLRGLGTDFKATSVSIRSNRYTIPMAFPSPAERDSAPAFAPPRARALSELEFDSRFLALPERFYTRLAPTPLPDPYPVAVNAGLARVLGLDGDAIVSPEGCALFAGNRLPATDRVHAAVYSGHQFGVWAGQLGDGRALSLGELATEDGPQELQLKGAGRTPYSRQGDGRAVLRSSIREFLCSEAMAALGIPTTRALCVMGSDEPVFRENVETAAVVTRVAPSFIRFGSFEHWFYRDDEEALRYLADFVIDHFYPECRRRAEPYAAWLQVVSERTARLIAQWQAVGFCHGVLNTDNMSILGLTLDYGPFGFMEAFDPGHICNHSDTAGRYAYGLQPQIGLWNLYALGQAVIPLIGSVDATRAALEAYKPAYETAFQDCLRAKLGLARPLPEDAELVTELFTLMAAQRCDFTLFFRALASVRAADAAGDAAARDLCLDRAAFDRWVERYRARLQAEGSDDRMRAQAMNRVNPKFVLRNYLAELAIRAAAEKDMSVLARLAQVLSRPFDEQPEADEWARLPPDWARGLEVSCSS